jgi:hypothetical protein
MIALQIFLGQGFPPTFYFLADYNYPSRPVFQIYQNVNRDLFCMIQGL